MIFSQNSHREEKLVGVFMCADIERNTWKYKLNLLKFTVKLIFEIGLGSPFPFKKKKISACRSEESVVARRFMIKCFRCRYLFLNLNNCGCFKDFKRTSSGIMRGIGDLLHTVSVLY